MPIKPIDFNVILPKSQELNSHKISEQLKHQNIISNNLVQREKTIEENKRKVLDAEKTEYTRINRNLQSKNKYKQQKKNKKNKENPNNKKKTILSGHKIDIQI